MKNELKNYNEYVNRIKNKVKFKKIKIIKKKL